MGSGSSLFSRRPNGNHRGAQENSVPTSVMPNEPTAHTAASTVAPLNHIQVYENSLSGFSISSDC